MEKMKNNLAALIKVKTIITLLLTIVFCALALTKDISGADFLTVFTVVIAFYFGTQNGKNAATVTDTGTSEGKVSTTNDVHPPNQTW